MLARLSTRRLSTQYTPRDPKSIEWASLGFSYVPTKTMVVANHQAGAWSAPALKEEPTLQIHALSNVLHYGQAIFEGLKAFTQKDGSIRVFRSDENAKRHQYGAGRLGMPQVSFFRFGWRRVYY
jgi:branched-chain amino acid aminotransferase